MTLLPKGTRGRAVQDAAFEQPCPYCGAGPGTGCVRVTGYARRNGRPTLASALGAPAPLHERRWQLGKAIVEELERQRAAAGGAP